MKIRFLNESDKDDICTLSYQINLDHHQNEPRYFRVPVEIGDDWEFWMGCHEKEGGFVLVCELEGNVVGFVACEISPMPNLPFVQPMIKSRIGTIVVAQQHQRKGIGTALFRRVCEISQERGAVDIGLEVFAFNARAVAFYQKLGFKPFAQRLSRSLV